MIARKLYYLWLLRRNCLKSRQELENIQKKKLRRIINHAYNNVPYYKGIFRARNLVPDDIRTVADLQKLPVLTRDILQDRFDEVRAIGTDISKCIIRRTSGSTGRPTSIAVEKKADDYAHALDFRSMFENGYRFHKKLLELTDPRHRGPENFAQKIGLFKFQMASVYDTTEEIRKKLIDFNPVFLKGYPSLLKNLSYLDYSNQQLSLEKIYSTSELLLKSDRKAIQDSFKADVIDLYGSVEFPRIAWECEKHEGYHMDIDSLVIELTDKGIPIDHGRGKMTITSLYNYAMPLIRYEVGDMAEINRDQKCSCHRNLPLLKGIYGRWNDRIVLPSGREIPPLILYNSDVIKGVKSFKIIQKKKDLFVVVLVKDKDFSKNSYAGFRDTILEACEGEKVRVRFEIVDSIPRDKSGKFRAVISEVKTSEPKVHKH